MKRLGVFTINEDGSIHNSADLLEHLEYNPDES
jgi:hypothetical protein